MPPYEIARTVRRAGFDPLAPPLREGSIYVVRATDFRGILMRVVVDARSGAIRDASRIVPGPGSYGSQAAMMPYEPLPNEIPAPYGPSADYDGAIPLNEGPVPPRSAATHPVTRASVIVLPPLPRPRPPEIAAGKPIDDAKPSAAKPEVTGSSVTAPAAPPAAASPAAPAASAPPASPATAAAKPGKSLEPPAIND